MASIIQFRRDTASNWTSNNPTLADGELGIESDTGTYKIGDGSTAWTSLGYGIGVLGTGFIDAKGDLILGTADNTVSRLAVGSNGQVLVADSSATTGVKWSSSDASNNWHTAVKLASAAALPNSPTYSNGSSGVGATLTSGSDVRLVVDGVNATAGDRVLVQDQSTATHNGLYDVTTQGSGSAAWVLTRADDFDGTPAGQVKAGDSVYAINGSTNSGQGFIVTSTSDPHVIGTNDITFTQFTGTQAITAGTGASITGNTINVGTASSARIVTNADNIDLATTSVTAASYGSATAVPGYTVDAYGRLTAASNTTIAILSTAVTDFTEATQDVAGAQLATNGSHTGITATYDDGGDGAVDLALVTENVQDITGAQIATNGSHTGITATYDDAGDGAVDLALVTENVQDITGAQLATNGAHTGITATYDDAGDGAVDLALITENVEDITGAQFATNGSHTGITATYDDAGDGAIDLALVTENVQDITGAQIATNGSHTGITATYDDGGDGAVDLALVTENVQDIVAGQLVTNGSHSGIAATYDDGGDGAIDLNVADFTITLGGDLTGNVTITDLASATLTATVAADSVALGTDSTGNYVATVAGTANEVDVSGSGSETAAVTIGLPSAVTVTTSLTTPLVNVTGASIVIEGATANDFETTLTVTDPTADRTITFGDETGTVFTTASVQALANGVTATTQSASDNSTKLATTAYVDTQATTASAAITSIDDADGDTKIQVEEGSDEDIIRFDTAGTERMTIGATGTVTITGDLTVNGTTTEISSTTITVDDKNIEIGSVASPDDTTADGGGLTLKGAADKTWNWVNSTDAWTSSEHIDLASGKAFYIAGTSVLNASTLGSGVTGSSLTSVGTLTALTVSGIATFSGTIAGASPFIFEGATADGFETTLAITDPTADRTITVPDVSGTVVTTGNLSAITALTDGTTATTQSANDSSTKVATTAFVMTEVGDYLTTSTASSTYAPIASPTLTGTPAAPTAAADTNTTQIATTAFVMTELGDYLTTSTASSTYAPIASPTLTGTPAAPTAAADTNTTQIATTAFVMTEVGDYLPLAGGTLTGNLIFEGATADAYETTLTVTDPTADRTITFADATGTVITSGNLTDITNVGVLTANLVFEGATDDGYETTLAITDPTADRTITLPNVTGTVITTGNAGALLDGTTATTQSQSDGSTKLATTAYVDNGLGALSSDSIKDADSDTKIQVEEASDEDKIRFDVAGSEFVVMDGSTVDVTGNVIDNIALSAQTGTTYTFVLADRGKLVTTSNGSAQSITVPPNSSVAYAVGTQVQVVGLGAGEVTMVAGSGVTLRSTPGLKLRAQYSSVTCIKIATDEWLLIGDLEA